MSRDSAQRGRDDFQALVAAIREALRDVPPREGYSVADLCARWKVGPTKVLGFIDRGELVAVNVSTHTSGRPQYRIVPEEVARFEALRSAVPLPKPSRKRRATEQKDYYPD
jgi:hypothetical protein